MYRSGFNIDQHWQNLYSMMLCNCPDGFGDCAPVNLKDYISFDGVPEKDSIVNALDKSLRAARYLILSFMYLDPQENKHAIETGLSIDPHNFNLLNRRSILDAD
jgi:hypothetical protein